MPVTLKIRTGTDHNHRNGATIARIAEQAGVQMLTVHGRTRADRFKGSAEYDTIATIVDAVSIPVIANGDIDSADKAKNGAEPNWRCRGDDWSCGAGTAVATRCYRSRTGTQHSVTTAPSHQGSLASIDALGD